MSRNLRRTVPVHPCKLKPEVIAPERLSKKDSELKQRQEENYDSRHRVHDLPPLTAGDQVYLPQMKTDATVRREYGERSYIVSTPNGQVRRNKRHLNSLPKDLATSPTILTTAWDEGCSSSPSSLGSGERHNPFWSRSATATETGCGID